MPRHTLPVLSSVISTALLALSGSAAAADAAPIIDPAKAAQLKRLEPLTSEKIDVFVEAGQLTRPQADYVKKAISPSGELMLSESAVGPEMPRVAAPQVVRQMAANPDPYASFGYTLSGADRDRLMAQIKNFRYGDHSEIGRELRQFRPAVNQLIAQSYTEPIDLPLKIKLWEEVAGAANPDAAIGLFETHRALYVTARPVLIPYNKDIGGVLVRRRVYSSAEPARPDAYFTSRDLRNWIEDTEGLIARSASTSAAIFLMNVYSQRYNEGEAPMRDKGRDRVRLVEACGGNAKNFDEDHSETWSSTLSVRERAIIADQLIPWVTRENSDRRKIARNGLMICLPPDHPDWKSGAGEWERWWSVRKNDLMAQQ